MKKYIISVCLFLCVVFSLSAQESLLSEATNGLFTNVNDWIIKPNVQFNTVTNDYCIIAPSFNGLKSQGGAELGYFHAGSIPFAVSAKLNFVSNKHLVEEKTVNETTKTTITTTYSNPAFNDMSGILRATVGFPHFLNLSAGIVVQAAGNINNEYKTLRVVTVNGVETESITTEYTLSSYKVVFSIPFGLEIGSVYNYAVPRFTVSGSKKEGSGINSTQETAFDFFMYDRITFFSLIPGGEKTNVWVGLGTTPTVMEELAQPAFDSSKDAQVNGQVGIANRVSIVSSDSISVVLNPQFYVDYLIGNNGSYKMGYTVASDIGLYAKIPGLPIASFFGMTPRLLFWHGTIIDERDMGKTSSTVLYSDRKLTTDILWSGKLGISILLPSDNTLDITCNVNDGENPVNLSAQMTIQL